MYGAEKIALKNDIVVNPRKLNNGKEFATLKCRFLLVKSCERWTKLKLPVWQPTVEVRDKTTKRKENDKFEEDCEESQGHTCK